MRFRRDRALRDGPLLAHFYRMGTRFFSKLIMTTLSMAFGTPSAYADEAPFWAHLFGDDSAVASRKLEIQDSNRDFESKERYGLVDRHARQAQHQRMEAFGSKLGLQALDLQARHGKEKMEDISKYSQAARIILTPAILATGAYMIYRGQPVQLRLSQDARLVGQTQVANRQGSVSLKHTHVDTGLSVNRQSGATEALRAHAARKIEFLNIDTQVGYGIDSQMLHSAVSRPLFAQVSGTYERSRSAHGGVGGYDAIKLNWGMSF